MDKEMSAEEVQREIIDTLKKIESRIIGLIVYGKVEDTDGIKDFQILVGSHEVAFWGIDCLKHRIKGEQVLAEMRNQATQKRIVPAGIMPNMKGKMNA